MNSYTTVVLDVLPCLEVPLLLVMTDLNSSDHLFSFWHSTLVNTGSLMFSVMVVAY